VYTIRVTISCICYFVFTISFYFMHFINLSGYLAASVQIKPVDQLKYSTFNTLTLRLVVIAHVTEFVEMILRWRQRIAHVWHNSLIFFEFYALALRQIWLRQRRPSRPLFCFDDGNDFGQGRRRPSFSAHVQLSHRNRKSTSLQTTQRDWLYGRRQRSDGQNIVCRRRNWNKGPNICIERVLRW